MRRGPEHAAAPRLRLRPSRRCQMVRLHSVIQGIQFVIFIYHHRLVQEGASVTNERTSFMNTALLKASFNGILLHYCLSLVAMCMCERACTSASLHSPATFSCRACHLNVGHFDIVRWLLEEGGSSAQESNHRYSLADPLPLFPLLLLLLLLLLLGICVIYLQRHDSALVRGVSRLHRHGPLPSHQRYFRIIITCPSTSHPYPQAGPQ
jgi:hypothetical protein